MKKPYQYLIIDDKTGAMHETNIEPLRHELMTYEPTDDPKISVLTQTKKAYVDNRYESKLRLYNYLTYTKKGLQIPKYKPFDGTNIGISEPILNF